MIDTLLQRLDVAVEHRAGAAAAHLVPCAMSSSHSSAVSLPRQIWSRTTGSKISAPPPVIEPRPASRKVSSVSRIDMRKIRLRQVPNFDGGKRFDVQIGIERAEHCAASLRYQSFFKVGCKPPTMCTSVTPRRSASSHRARFPRSRVRRHEHLVSSPRMRRTGRRECRCWSN